MRKKGKHSMKFFGVVILIAAILVGGLVLRDTGKEKKWQLGKNRKQLKEENQRITAKDRELLELISDLAEMYHSTGC